MWRLLLIILKIHLRYGLIWLIYTRGAYRLGTPLSTHFVHYKWSKFWFFSFFSPAICEFEVKIILRRFCVLMSWHVICLKCLFYFFRMTLLTIFFLWRAVVILEIQEICTLVPLLSICLNRACVPSSCFNLICDIEVKQIVICSCSGSRLLFFNHIFYYSYFI